MIYKKILKCALLIFSMAPACWGAGTGNFGTDFWLTFPLAYEFAPTPELFITAGKDTSGTIQIPGVGFTAPFAVSGGSTATIVLPLSVYVTPTDGVTAMGIHVNSLDPVAVTGFDFDPSGSDGYLAIPTANEGSHYFNLTYQDLSYAYHSELAVVGTQNGTSVTITPPINVRGHAAGTPYVVALNQGDVYQLINDGTGGFDLSGTQIDSNNPIGAWGAVACGDVPPGVGACNYLVEQLWPTAQWGTLFYTVPLATRLLGDTFRFMASQNSTPVSVNGALVATLNQGQFFETILTAASEITAGNPIYVMQYSNGRIYDGVPYADSSMISIPPVNGYGDDYLISIPVTNWFVGDYENITAPTSAAGLITLDGTPIPAASFSPIGTTGYSGASVTVSAATHYLSGPASFGVIAYGFGLYDAYGYPGPAGVTLGPTDTPTITPSPSPSATFTPTPTVTISFTPTVTFTPSPTPTITPTLTLTVTMTPSPSPTITLSPTPVCETHVWPNPFDFQYAYNSEVKIDCLPLGASVLFFTVSGEKVAQRLEQGGMAQWDGRGPQGARVAPGIYFYLVESQSKVLKRGKLLVTR